MALTTDQTAFLARLIGPDAQAAYNLHPVLDLPGLLADAGGDMRVLAAQVLEHLCAQARAGVTAGAVDIKLGSLAIKTAVPSSAQADIWCARASALRAQVETLRRQAARSGSLVVPVVTDWG